MLQSWVCKPQANTNGNTHTVKHMRTLENALKGKQMQF